MRPVGAADGDEPWHDPKYRLHPGGPGDGADPPSVSDDGGHMRTLPGSRIGVRAERRREQAFTLIEVLVAAAVAAIVLAGAYGWLWNVAALAGETDDRVQAGTLAAAAARAVGGDVRAAVGVGQPPAGRDPARSLSLAHDHVDVAPEDVLIVWDPARAVVWRNASGTYIADHITGFAVVYGLVDGRWLSGAGDARIRLAARALPPGGVGGDGGIGDGVPVPRDEGGAGVKRRRDAAGYVMLAVLLVMVLAATFALVVVAAVHGMQMRRGL